MFATNISQNRYNDHAFIECKLVLTLAVIVARYLRFIATRSFNMSLNLFPDKKDRRKGEGAKEIGPIDAHDKLQRDVRKTFRRVVEDALSDR